MGNSESKRDEQLEDSRDNAKTVNSGNVNQRSFRETPKTRKELVSVPVDSRCFDIAETPSSENSGDEGEHLVNEEDLVGRLSSHHDPLTVENPHRHSKISSNKTNPQETPPPSQPEAEQKLASALQFNLVQQMYNKFVFGDGSASPKTTSPTSTTVVSTAESTRVELIAGFIDVGFYEQITTIAETIGFESAHFDSPFCRLSRTKEAVPPTVASNHLIARENILKSLEKQVDVASLTALDKAVEGGLEWYLAFEVKTRKDSDVTSKTLFQHKLNDFILPEVVMEKIFRKVAQDFKLKIEITEDGQIAIVRSEEDDLAAEAVQTNIEKTIQKGELVWRRLQHWSTNVRKEKKFNIWAKGLPENVKSKIRDIALEIGFEAAQVQQNGNIHLEIKPPEGQHRRKLKHATDDLRTELIPIDEAVCENVEQHLDEWLFNFQKSGREKDILNCRFVLPAEWLRKTSTRLATQYGCCVKMETGIELLFYRADVDLSAMQEAENSLKAVVSGNSGGGSESVSGKKKTKQRKKKASGNIENNEEEGTVQTAPAPVAVAAAEDESNASSSTLELNNNSNNLTGKVSVETDPQQHPELIGHGSVQSPHRVQKRPVGGRNKCVYGWDPNWPIAHLDREA